jgi:hypothetical protein
MADAVAVLDEKSSNASDNGQHEENANPKSDFTIKPLETPIANPEDPAASSKEVSSKRQRISDLFTILCAGFALISDGYQNNLMTMTNVKFWFQRSIESVHFGFHSGRIGEKVQFRL